VSGRAGSFATAEQNRNAPMKSLARILLPLALLVLATSASATPITYSFLSGTAELDITVDGNSAATVATDLDGTFVVYDAMTTEIPDFELVTSDSIGVGPLTLNLDLSATPGSGYSSGPGTTTTVLLDPVMITLAGLLEVPVFSDVPFDEDISVGPVGADVSVVGNQIEVSVMEMVASFRKAGKDISVTANIDFVGVPEPGVLLLLLVGALALGLRAARSRVARPSATA